MRGTQDLLLRLFLSLVLAMAAWPASAGEASCAAPVRVPNLCAMACCASRPMAHCADKAAMTSSLPRAPARGRDRGMESGKSFDHAACGCEIKAPPARSARVVVGTIPAPDAFALPPAPLVAPTFRPVADEPGIVGLDAGPPPRPPSRADASRAPPIARA